MRKTSKLLSLVLAVLMMLSIVSVSASAQYTDVSVDDTALNDAVNLLTTLGVAYGTTETTFAPDENVTRQQMAAFIYRLMKAGKQVTGGNNTSGFVDLDDSTFYYMVSWTADNGIIKGTSATTFNPKGGITLQDAYVMLVRALGYEKDTTLPYPIGFIDVAEDLGLDEDLPSTLQYTDTLTRGQVAILLANAFYADMNEVTTEYEWKSNGVADANGDFTYAYVPVETVETIAHKIFGVVEETFQVFATAHKAFGAGYSALYNERDVDRVEGVRRDDDGTQIGTVSSFKMSELGLSGSSDDYFMDKLTLFVKKDTSDVTKDKVLAAKSNLIKKTVMPADVVLERSNKADDKLFYVGADKNDDQVMTGYATFGGIKAYLDKAQAPYSYVTVDKKNSVKFIDLTGVSYDSANTTYKYDFVASNIDFDNVYGANSTNGAYDKLDTAFDAAYPRIYNEGLYELDVYDVDGDGYAEYVMEKPYTFAQVLVKTNRKYAGLTGSFPKTFYTEDAVVSGTFANEDYVLAYIPYSGSTALKYVEVKEVITPVESMIASKADTTDSKKLTLESGDALEFVDAAKKLANYNYASANFTTDFTVGKTLKAYMKNGVLLYSDNISNDNFDSNANYAIVLKYDDNAATYYKADNTSATASNATRVVYEATGVVNGEFKTYKYVKAIIDGAVKGVKLADYAYTHVAEGSTNGTYNIDTDVESLKITDTKVAETVMYHDFLNKFATYTVDGDSAYTFTALNIATTPATVFADTNKEDSVLYTAAASDTIGLKHYTGAIYEITTSADDNGATGTVTNIGNATKFTLKDYSKIIIKTREDNEDVYTEYTMNTLPKFDTTIFSNVKAIFVNNKGSNIESIGILYAEINDFGSKSAEDFRIVTAVTKALNANKKAIDVVTILDPKTGATTTNVEVASGYTPAVNHVVKMREDGKVEKATIATAFAEEAFFKATFTGYDEDNKFMTISENNKTYVLNDNTTILYYTKSDKFEMVDTDILAVGLDNTIMDLGASDTTFGIYLVGTEDDDNSDIINVKTIVVADKNNNTVLG